MRGSNPVRRRSARLIASALAGALVLGAPGTSLADNADNADNKELHQARQDLRETKAKIRARMKKMNALQRDLNRLATEMFENQQQIAAANQKMGKLQFSIDALEARTATLQRHLDERNREAYIQGPGAPVLYLLTATSAAEAAARLSLITEMNRRDEVLAARVQENRERLTRNRAELLRLQRARELAMQQLAIQRVELRKEMRQSRRLFDLLKAHKDDVLETIAKYRPFAVCPVDGPVAITSNFGVMVIRPKKWGGNHIHQGNDMMAAAGTPIVAPFDGVAVNARNKIGGLAVKVYGEFGYVYNAHMSAYGQLGPVKAGDVVGYVGATGDTGANHDHFEWHPSDGPAVDPNPFLLKVC